MTTKEKLLTLLENRRGSFVSGEEAAQELSVTRAAIWKAVRALCQEGYPIDAVPNRGYCLSKMGDVLSAQGIAKFLNPEMRPLVEKSLDSTNAAARRLAERGEPEGTVVLRQPGPGAGAVWPKLLLSGGHRRLSEPAAASRRRSPADGAAHGGGGCGHVSGHGSVGGGRP